MNQRIERLTDMAARLRLDAVEMVHYAGDGHPGPALSCADIVTALYFDVMNIDPATPLWPTRDRFILSKGHAAPVYYAALARRGFFPVEQLKTLRAYHSILQGHPVMGKTPGVDVTTGSLGHGISLGVGMALGCRMQNLDNRVYVIVGDGELNEGLNWEGIASAVHHKLDRLILFVDANGYQSGGRVDTVSGDAPLLPKLESFGLRVMSIDGHSMEEILQAIELAKQPSGLPTAIVCSTIKGKGLPFMEGDNSWHKRVPSADQLAKAQTILGGDTHASH